MRNRYKRDINRLIQHPRRLPSSRALRNPGGLSAVYSTGIGLTREAGEGPVDLLWISTEQPNDTGRLWEALLTSRGEISIDMVSTADRGIALYENDKYTLNQNDEVEKNGQVIAAAGLLVANDISVVKSAVTGQIEIWVSGMDSNEEAVANVYDSSGALLKQLVLPYGTYYAGGYIFLSTSPHYYLWGDNGGIQLKRIADDVVVRNLDWCGAGPHEQTGLIDVNDELVAFACLDSVSLTLVSDGSTVSVAVDTAYLDTYDQGLQGVQLSNETLTVFGSNRLIHYRILRDESGSPSGSEEVSRHEYDTVENYNLHLSTDRSKLKSVAPA